MIGHFELMIALQWTINDYYVITSWINALKWAILASILFIPQHYTTPVWQHNAATRVNRRAVELVDQMTKWLIIGWWFAHICIFHVCNIVLAYSKNIYNWETAVSQVDSVAVLVLI